MKVIIILTTFTFLALCIQQASAVKSYCKGCRDWCCDYSCEGECGQGEQCGQSHDCAPGLKCGPNKFYCDGVCHCMKENPDENDPGYGSCFWSENEVETLERGVIKIKQLKQGEHVLSVGTAGTVAFSEVLLSMDSGEATTTFNQVTTRSGKQLMLTANHLIHVHGSSPKFSSSLQIGEEIMVIDNSTLVADPIVSIREVVEKGANSPLTASGSIIVADVLASCYAAYDDHEVAHLFMSPLRAYLRAKKFAQYIGLISEVNQDETSGKHPYIEALLSFSKMVNLDKMHQKYHQEM